MNVPSLTAIEQVDGVIRIERFQRRLFMKNLRIATAIAATLAALTFGNVSEARAADSFSFSFKTGDVAFAYSDGYLDREPRWHSWRNSREHRNYRERYRDNYKAVRSSRERNRGWRGDQDRDGIPNRVDRDRDGDGVSNRRDDAPNNPRRD